MSAKVIADPVTKRSKCYGFLKFTENEDCVKAHKEMDGQSLLGKFFKLSIVNQNQGQGSTDANTAGIALSNQLTYNYAKNTQENIDHIYYAIPAPNLAQYDRSGDAGIKTMPKMFEQPQTYQAPSVNMPPPPPPPSKKTIEEMHQKPKEKPEVEKKREIPKGFLPPPPKGFIPPEGLPKLPAVPEDMEVPLYSPSETMQGKWK